MSRVGYAGNPDQAAAPAPRYLVWGCCRSWVVHTEQGGRVTWSSQWFATRELAEAHAEKLRRRAPEAA